MCGGGGTRGGAAGRAHAARPRSRRGVRGASGGPGRHLPAPSAPHGRPTHPAAVGEQNGSGGVPSDGTPRPPVVAPGRMAGVWPLSCPRPGAGGEEPSPRALAAILQISWPAPGNGSRRPPAAWSSCRGMRYPALQCSVELAAASISEPSGFLLRGVLLKCCHCGAARVETPWSPSGPARWPP